MKLTKLADLDLAKQISSQLLQFSKEIKFSTFFQNLMNERNIISGTKIKDFGITLWDLKLYIFFESFAKIIQCCYVQNYKMRRLSMKENWKRLLNSKEIESR